MGNIELFALDNTIGNKVLIYLNSGKEISGVVAEIGDNFILITKEDGKQMRLFENIIGAWETIESVPDSALPDNDDPSEKEGNNTQLSVSSDSMPIAEPKPATENEPLKEESKGNPDNLSYEPKAFGLKIVGKIDLSQFDKKKPKITASDDTPQIEPIQEHVETSETAASDDSTTQSETYYQSKLKECRDKFASVVSLSSVDLEQDIPTNSTVKLLDNYPDAFGTALSDNGLVLLLQEEGYVGDPEILLCEGKRIFCRPTHEDSPCLCYVAISCMSYKELIDSFNTCLENHWIVKAISILKSMRQFPGFESIADDLKQIYETLKSLSRHFYKESITIVTELSAEEEERVAKHIKDYISRESKEKPLKDGQLRNAYIYKYRTRIPVELFVSVREKLGILSDEYRKQSFSFIQNISGVQESLDALNSRFDIDTNTLLYHLNCISSELEPRFDFTPEENAVVRKVNKNSCIVTLDGKDMRCYYNSVLDFDFIKRMSENPSEEYPVRAFTFLNKKTGETLVSSIVNNISVRDHITKLIKFVEDGNYVYARRYNQNIQSIIKPFLSSKGNKHLTQVISILKTVSFAIPELPVIAISYSDKVLAEQETSKKEVVLIITKVDNTVAEMSNLDVAIRIIDDSLTNPVLIPKDIAVLLQKKVQLYSSFDNIDNAIVAYKDWVNYGISNNLFTEKKLSRLFADLARIQFSVTGYEENALESLDRAIEYNPNNKLALNLREQVLEAISSKNQQNAGVLTVDSDNKIAHSIDVVSAMLDLDIQEHKFTDKRIKNCGGPSPEIAAALFEEAKQSMEAESYPLFLETAKAFHDLKFYDHQDYLFIVANYARLKGNSLIKTFRKTLLSYISAPSSDALITLSRLKDSAQSYYMESLNLWSFISLEEDDDESENTTTTSFEDVVLEVLVNYLIIDVAFFYATSSKLSSYDFNGLFNMSFKDVFSDCLKSNSEELTIIAAGTIVKVGSYSSSVWNRLASIPNGTRELYDFLSAASTRDMIYSAINKLEETQFCSEMKPGDMLQAAFQKHSSDRYEFEKQSSKLREEVLSPHGMENVTSRWSDLNQYYRLLSSTDLESASKIDEIIKVLKPYPHRGDEERSTLLYQVTEIIDEQIRFINSNTTFYGRTFFYPLLTKWANEIKSIRKERVASKHPQLSVTPDPSYILSSEGRKSISLVIRNTGETTAEGFVIKLSLNPHSGSMGFEYENRVDTEIPSGQLAGLTIDFDESIDCSSGIDAWAEVAAIYQSNVLPGIEINFTLEEEPESTLEFEDIIWSDGPITPPDLFFGRQELIDKFEKHYLSSNRHKPYILYGLTRTGKSSIAKYLGEQITGKQVRVQGQMKTVLHFSMDLDDAAKCPNAKEVWDFFIRKCLFERIQQYAIEYQIDVESCRPSTSPRSYELEDVLRALNKCGYYPFITMDEFSHMKTLISSGRLTSAFLHTLRKDTFEGLASFMYIGTYDINDLLTDKQYGITGQLTHCISYQLNEIDEASAKSLINVLGDKLVFTEDAQDFICTLSGCVPYFIQIICQNCGNYAVEHKRRFIGYPELLEVVKILTGETEIYDDDSSLQRLTINTFEDNQYSANDPIYVQGLVASISYLNRDCDENNVPPHGVAIDELERLWTDYGITNAKYFIGEAIKILKAKKIIEVDDKEIIPTYVIIVDLYRRWCKVEFPDINLALSSLLNQEN